MTIRFEDGLPAFPNENVARLLRDLSTRLSYVEISRLDSLFLRALLSGHAEFSDREIWPLLRIAYESGMVRHVQTNGLPSVPYQLSGDFDLEGVPFGAEYALGPMTLQDRPKKIAGFEVDFPLGVSASIVTANSHFLRFYAARGFDILTYKTVRSRPHPGNEYPHWVFLNNVSQRLMTDEVAAAGFADPKDYSGHLERFIGRQRYFPLAPERASMANSFGVPSHDPEWWMSDIASARQFIRKGHQILIVSVMASSDDPAYLVSDFVKTAEMAKEVGADIIELNFSCPNTKDEGAGAIYNSPVDAHEIATSVRNAVKIPVFAKIGYLPEPKLRQFMKAVAPAVDGLVAINTISARVDDLNGRPIFPGRTNAGLSGWVIRDVAQGMAQNLVNIRDEMKLQDDLCLLGLGGVMNEADFYERLDTGVDAVEICTGAFLDPLIGLKVRKASSRGDNDRDRGTIKKGVPMGAVRHGSRNGAVANASAKREKAAMAKEPSTEVRRDHKLEDDSEEARRFHELARVTRVSNVGPLWRGFDTNDPASVIASWYEGGKTEMRKEEVVKSSEDAGVAEQMLRDVLSDPEKIRENLIELGVLDKSGNPSKPRKRYKSPQ